MSGGEWRPDQAGGAFFSRQVLAGVPWVLLGKVAFFFIYLLIPIITVRSLGPQKYGLFALVRTVGEFTAVLCGLGLGTAIVRFVPELCVARNRAGLVRMLQKIAALQCCAWLAAACALYFGEPYLNRWFNVEFGHLLLLAALLGAAQLSRGFLSDTLTSLFKVRSISILSLLQGLVWFGLVALIVPRRPEVHVVMLVMVIPVFGLSAAALALLIRHVRTLQWRSPGVGVGKRRVLGISLPSILNVMANVVLSQHSELFFLGLFFTPTLVGQYELGCSVPFSVIAFLPQAIQSLFTSGFAEAYARDKQCLGRLVTSLYKALIILIEPFAALGFFFAPAAFKLMYGAEMKEAGDIAALFFVVHTLSLVSMPLSMAIVTKEKVLHVQPLMALQIAVNLVLDYVLIPRWGMYGGVAAIVGTWVLTTPIRFYVVARLVGGIYFPVGFFLRFVAVLFPMAAAFSPLADHVNLVGLFAVGFVYMGLYLVLIRVLRLLRPEDVAPLRAMNFAQVNWVLDWIVRR